MERKARHLELWELKAVDGGDEGHGYIEGYGAVKNNIDSYGDVIADGAFKDLEEFTVSGFMGDSHQWDKNIGYIVEAREDEKGLWVKMAFHSTDDAQRIRTKTRERLAAGKKVGLSIGYFVTDRKEEERDGQTIRVLTGVEVFEVSIVTMPANQMALVASAKSVSADSTAKGFGEEFDTLAQGVSDYLDRAAKAAPDRGETWKAERCEQYRRMAEKLTAEADAMEAKDRQAEPEPIDLSELDALMAQEQGLR